MSHEQRDDSKKDTLLEFEPFIASRVIIDKFPQRPIAPFRSDSDIDGVRYDDLAPRVFMAGPVDAMKPHGIVMHENDTRYLFKDGKFIKIRHDALAEDKNPESDMTIDEARAFIEKCLKEGERKNKDYTDQLLKAIFIYSELLQNPTQSS